MAQSEPATAPSAKIATSVAIARSGVMSETGLRISESIRSNWS
jgi:hypothetical protein